MEKQIINITDEQKQNLVDEIATLVAKFKKDEDVECIYFSSYKGLGKISGNVLELIVVTKGNLDEISKGFCEYNKMHQEHKSVRKFGVKIYVMFDEKRKYTYLPLNPSELIRENNLFNSIILFDRNGKYTTIKENASNHGNIKSGVFEYENFAEIYPPIDDSIKMELEKHPTKELTKKN